MPQPEELLDLITDARSGHMAAQEALISHFQTRIAGFVLAMIGRDAEVEDITQTIFIRMLNSFSSLRDPRQFTPWLFQLARNACLDHLRRRKWRDLFSPFLPEHGEVASVPAPALPDTLAWLRQALLTLPPPQRELIVLLSENDLTYEDLARITGSSVSSVKSRLFRARETLNQRRNHDPIPFPATAVAPASF